MVGYVLEGIHVLSGLLLMVAGLEETAIAKNKASQNKIDQCS